MAEKSKKSEKKEVVNKSNSAIKMATEEQMETLRNFVKTYSADLFVSLHLNSAVSSAKGFEVYYSKSNNKANASGLTSKLFATRMVNALDANLNLVNRGVKKAEFVVTKNNTVPAIVVEIGFISNTSDRNKLKKASFQKKAAKTIYQCITSTFKKYPTDR